MQYDYLVENYNLKVTIYQQFPNWGTRTTHTLGGTREVFPCEM